MQGGEIAEGLLSTSASRVPLSWKQLETGRGPGAVSYMFVLFLRVSGHLMVTVRKKL